MRVGIVGAGVAGPVLAMLLKHKLGWQPAVFEAAHAIREVRTPYGHSVRCILGLFGSCPT